jgi:nicotinate-nucleotide adenylyltransferase
MVLLACEGQPLFEPSRLEEGGEANYSIDTIESFRRTLQPNDALQFLIGVDAFNEIESWHRSDDLVRAVDFIVVSRPGADLRIPKGARVFRLDEVSLNVSSTDIRERLAKGEPTPELPALVRAYIDAHHLYGAP